MSSQKLKINILTGGRFHLLDLARELSKLGHDVRFFSYVPKQRSIKYGLPKECHMSLLPYVFPLIAWQKYFPKLFPVLREFLLHKILNLVCILKAPKSDVVIAMSGIFYEALIYLKKKHGSLICLHRGSKHILVQEKILAQFHQAEKPTKYIIARELKGYLFADFIVVPSEHARDSFKIEHHIYSKCVVLPYGVDLKTFPLKHRNKVIDSPKGLFVGLWSYQKGCDLIYKSVRDKEYHLTHVGDIGDLTFERNKNLIHYPRVDQQALSRFYHSADYFVLASRQDGFGIVLTQALASGMPVLTTYDTGGSDLQLTPSLSDNIVLVESDNWHELQRGFDYIINRLQSGPPFLEITQEDRLKLSWSGYGDRYNQFLVEAIG